MDGHGHMNFTRGDQVHGQVTPVKDREDFCEESMGYRALI